MIILVCFETANVYHGVECEFFRELCESVFSNRKEQNQSSGVYYPVSLRTTILALTTIA